MPRPLHTRAHALAAAGHLAYCQGEYATAEHLVHQAGALADQLGDELLGGVVLHFLASIARWRGELERTRSLYESALAVYHRLGHRLWTATALVHLAFVLCEQGDLVRAAARAEARSPFQLELATLLQLAGWRVRRGHEAVTSARRVNLAVLNVSRDVGTTANWRLGPMISAKSSRLFRRHGRWPLGRWDQQYLRRGCRSDAGPPLGKACAPSGQRPPGVAGGFRACGYG